MQTRHHGIDLRLGRTLAQMGQRAQQHAQLAQITPAVHTDHQMEKHTRALTPRQFAGQQMIGAIDNLFTTQHSPVS